MQGLKPQKVYDFGLVLQFEKILDSIPHFSANHRDQIANHRDQIYCLVKDKTSSLIYKRCDLFVKIFRSKSETKKIKRKIGKVSNLIGNVMQIKKIKN